MDAVGVARAHVVGYSMGGWIASAMIVHCSERLTSVVIGGWDPGPPDPAVPPSTLGFEELLAFGRREVPEQMEWITAAVEPAVRCCWEAVDEVVDIDPALRTFRAPVLLWNGARDSSAGPAARLAARHTNVEVLETPGDHMSTWFNDDGTAKRALRRFVDSAAHA